MSYNDYYFGRELAGQVGLGNIWLLKNPKLVGENSDGGSFLGSLVEFADRWFLSTDYPIPRLAGVNDQIFLKILNSLKNDDGTYISTGSRSNILRNSDDHVKCSDTASISASVKKVFGLNSVLNFDIPGIPLNIDLKLDLSSLDDVKLNIENPRIEYIKGKVLCAMSAIFDEDLEALIDKEPSLIDLDNLENCQIVDEVLYAKKYSLQFKTEDSLDGKVEIGGSFPICGTPVEVGVGVEAKVENNNTISITVNNGNEYLIGMKTVSWADCDFD